MMGLKYDGNKRNVMTIKILVKCHLEIYRFEEIRGKIKNKK